MNGKIIEQNKKEGNEANALAPADGDGETQFAGRGLAIAGVLIAFRALIESPAISTHPQPTGGSTLLLRSGWCRVCRLRRSFQFNDILR
jgi:hypothetical protein